MTNLSVKKRGVAELLVGREVKAMLERKPGGKILSLGKGRSRKSSFRGEKGGSWTRNAEKKKSNTRCHQKNSEYHLTPDYSEERQKMQRGRT